MPLALGSFMAISLGYAHWAPKGFFSFAYGSTWILGALALWFLSGAAQHIGVLALLGFAGIALLSTFVALFGLKAQPQGVAAWLIRLLLIGLLVSYFSGRPGKLGILKLVLERLGISDDSVALVV